MLQQKQRDRLKVGRVNIVIGSGATGNHSLQKQYSLGLHKSPAPSSLPPLEGKVLPLILGGALADQGKVNTDSQMAPSKMLTIRDMEKLAKASNDGTSVWLKKGNWEKVLACFKTHKAERIVLSGTKTTLTAEVKKLTAENAQLTQDLQASLDLQAEAAAHYNSKRVRAKAKKGPTKRKDEQKEDVSAAIAEYVKLVLFRTIKFALPGNQLEAVMKLVWDGIKDRFSLDKGPNPMDLDDFTEIYESQVLTSLSNRRQYHQTRCQKAAQGT